MRTPRLLLPLFLAVTPVLALQEPTADAAVGMIAVRYTTAGTRKLSQQAMVQVSTPAAPGERPGKPAASAGSDLYYILDFTTPVGKSDATAGAAPADAGAPTPDEKL